MQCVTVLGDMQYNVRLLGDMQFVECHVCDVMLLHSVFFFNFVNCFFRKFQTLHINFLP